MLGGATAQRRAAALVLSLTILSTCGDAVGPRQGAPETPPDPDPTSELVFTKPDGSTFSVRPTSITCAPSEYDPDVEVVNVEDGTRRAYVVIEVVPADVVGGATYDLPVSSGDMESGPTNAFVFFGNKDFEVSTVQEESTGTLEVSEASCDPLRLALSIDATLDSEYSDGESLSVSGQLDLTG